MARLGRNFNFPDPTRVTIQNPTHFCTKEIVVALYNQETGSEAKNFSQAVIGWFSQTAFDAGWTHVTPIKNGDQQGMLLGLDFSKLTPKVLMLE